MNHQMTDDIFQQYQAKPRKVTAEFVDALPWDDMKLISYSDEIINVLIYMRDIEDATSIYYDELNHSPSAKHPILKKFLDQWDKEEAQHSCLLDKFLNCVRPDLNKNWRKQMHQSISWRYRIENAIMKYVNKLFGKHFLALHMTWGAINEYSTLLGYLSLSEQCEDPHLKSILKAICMEEAIHGEFYLSMADYFLKQSRLSQIIAKTVINIMWTPVGEGIKPIKETAQVIKKIFPTPDAIARYDRVVTQKIQKLAGFANFSKPTIEIGKLAL